VRQAARRAEPSRGVDGRRRFERGKIEVAKAVFGHHELVTQPTSRPQPTIDVGKSFAIDEQTP
jgi:hypothetical protein